MSSLLKSFLSEAKATLHCRLFWWITLSVFLCVIVVQAVILVPSYQHFELAQLDRLEHEGFAVIETLLISEKEKLIDFDQLVQIGDELADRTAVEGADIYNLEGELVAKFGKEPDYSFRQIDKLFSQDPLHRVEDERWLHTAWGPKQLELPYYVIVRLDVRFLPSAFFSFLVRTVTHVFYVAIVLTLVLLLLVSRKILKPIIALRQSLIAFREEPENPQAHHLAMKLNNEIGDVIDVFNEMLEQAHKLLTSLSEKKQALNKMNAELDTKVQQRTAELEYTNQILRQQIEQREQAEAETISVAKFPSESPNPMLRISEKGTIIYHNRASHSILSQWQVGLGDIIPEQWCKLVSSTLLTNEEKEIELSCANRVYLLNFVPIKQQNYVNLYGVDISLRKQHEEKLKHMSSHDILTGLPNRVLYKELVDQTMQWSKGSGKMTAVTVMAINEFETLSKLLGHHGSEILLHRVAERLARNLPDRSVIGCISSNEYSVAFGGLEQTTEVDSLLTKINEAVTGSYQILNQEIQLSVNFGVAVHPMDADNADDLIKNASLALFYSNEDLRTSYCYYMTSMNEQMEYRQRLLTDLRYALVREQFQILYQPQIEIQTKRIIGFESLLRWQHPEFGMISPAEFIGLAEESELIIPIGEWVLQQTASQLLKWQRDYNLSLRGGVNLSLVQFRKGDIVTIIKHLLHKYPISPHNLELEITESTVSHNIEEAISTLHSLRSLGVSLAIDDFGTGYSSMSYLKQFPVDRLKIDKSFVDDLHADEDSRAIIRAIIHLGHSLGLAVIGEGVETEAQVELLKEYGCDEIQGYYFSPPVPLSSFHELVTADQS